MRGITKEKDTLNKRVNLFQNTRKVRFDVALKGYSCVSRWDKEVDNEQLFPLEYHCCI